MDKSIVINKSWKIEKKYPYSIQHFISCYSESILPYLDIDFRLELPHVDEISDSEKHVLEEIVELAYQMQVLCQFLVKALIPVWRRAVHANERLKGLSFISWKRGCQMNCVILRQ